MEAVLSAKPTEDAIGRNNAVWIIIAVQTSNLNVLNCSVWQEVYCTNLIVVGSIPGSVKYIFQFYTPSDWLWGLTTPHFNWNRGLLPRRYGGRSVKLTTPFHSMLRSRRVHPHLYSLSYSFMEHTVTALHSLHLGRRLQIPCLI